MAVGCALGRMDIGVDIGVACCFLIRFLTTFHLDIFGGAGSCLNLPVGKNSQD